MAGPLRTCIGCRRTAEAHELVRVVRSQGGGLVAGRSAPGRGAWLCAGSPACVDLAQRRNAFARSLRGEVSTEAVAALRTELEDSGSG